MKKPEEIINIVDAVAIEPYNNPFWSKSDVIKYMEEYAKHELVAFKKWYDKLSPSDKCSVWSESGESQGLFTMSDKKIVEKYFEDKKS